jgi:hypothetical protein
VCQYDAQHNSLISAGNGGTKPLQAAFTIYYNQGTQKYELEQTLQPHEQMWIGVGKLIREQVADKNGNTLPGDLTSGSYEFRDLTNKGVGNLFEGKVVYDKTYGHATFKRMEETKWLRGDKYYHCIANCEATNAGPGGAVAAKVISFFRTDVRSRITEPTDWQNDKKANTCGQQGGNCDQTCAPFVPKYSPGKPQFHW